MSIFHSASTFYCFWQSKDALHANYFHARPSYKLWARRIRAKSLQYPTRNLWSVHACSGRLSPILSARSLSSLVRGEHISISCSSQPPALMSRVVSSHLAHFLVPSPFIYRNTWSTCLASTSQRHGCALISTQSTITIRHHWHSSPDVHWMWVIKDYNTEPWCVHTSNK